MCDCECECECESADRHDTISDSCISDSMPRITPNDWRMPLPVVNLKAEDLEGNALRQKIDGLPNEFWFQGFVLVSASSATGQQHEQRHCR